MLNEPIHPDILRRLKGEPPPPVEKILPSNTDSERMVLGSLLLRGLECYGEVAVNLDKADFALEKHRVIFAAIARLGEKQQAIDHMTVANELTRLKELESVDGLSYLVSLDDHMPVIANLDAYVGIIREKAARRRGAVLCQQSMNRFLADEEDAGDILASLVVSAEAIETAGGSPDWQKATDIAREYPGGWQALVSPAGAGRASGIGYPWPRVQQVVCGMQKGELTILAGRPAMGKSALAMQIALHAAGNKFGVAYVSLEMTGPALVRREVAQTARVDSNRMRLGYLNFSERSKLVEARTIIEALPLHIESRQRRGRTAASLLASLRWLRAREPLDLAVIDHFHLIDGPEREERVKYNRIADALQRGARDMEIPFLVLAQLNRRCEEERREPGLPDLKECGKIEENADVVLFIHRPEMYAHNRDREDLRGMADLIIGKQRDGDSGKAGLVFIREQTRFESRAEDIQ
jgi:replicative DNA helicase